jgi:bifunctional non-homologous end joining protein LigD
MSAFVVQLHKARTLHYDFRLEIDGALKSWVLPKGPSLDPNVKRLSIMVADHDLSFAAYEGRIPEGEYGTGEITIWDQGSWEFIPDPSEGIFSPTMALRKGSMRFTLHGKRLSGAWRLVRGTKAVKHWLLIKSRP